MEEFYQAETLLIDNEIDLAIEVSKFIFSNNFIIVLTFYFCQLYTTTIEKLPLFGLAYSHRGACYIKKRKFTLALADFSKATSLGVTDDINYYRKGVSYFELGEFESAKKTLETGLQLRKNKNKETINYERIIRKCNLELEGWSYIYILFLILISFQLKNKKNQLKIVSLRQ